MDSIIEGTVINSLWGPLAVRDGVLENNPLAGMLSTKDFKKNPTGESLARDFGEAIDEARKMGHTDEEIKKNIRLNLQTYNFNADTFPIDDWMKR
jgi:hypothetical protein